MTPRTGNGNGAEHEDWATVRGDRETGKAWRYAVAVAVIVVAIVLATVQVLSAAEDKVERAVASRATHLDLQLRNTEIMGELRLIRTERSADARELAKVLQRIDERLGILEDRARR